MAFKNGDIKPKNSGRKTGSLNKTTKEIKDILTSAIEDGKEKAMRILNEMEGKDYLDYYLRFAEFVMPKKKAIEHSGGIETEQDIYIINGAVVSF